MAPRVLCRACGLKVLQRVDESENTDAGYLCKSWEKDPPGEGCHRLIRDDEFAELLEDMQAGNCDEPKAGKAGGPAVSPVGDAKRQNVAAILKGDIQVQRTPLLGGGLLTVQDGAAVIRRAYKNPLTGGTGMSKELMRRLHSRHQFVPWGSPRQATVLPEPEETITEQNEEESLPPGVEPLVLWQPEPGDEKVTESSKPILVDNVLVKFLRAHQREGVQFMFECIGGLRDFSKKKNMEDGMVEDDNKPKDEGCFGCILADDMGLGKTLQSITLVWTLLRQGFDGSPLAKRIVIVTPTSLVGNWENEFSKWLPGRVDVLALCESTRSDVLQGIASFLAPRRHPDVLIISYETFRLHADKFKKKGSCDLLLCDEAHRLKNDKTLTNQALDSLPCRRRVLLSGTPMQNDLEEFFAMVNFTNPGILGIASSFRRHYENPILIGREPDASDAQRALSADRSAELSEKVNQFILRRTNALLSNHLPPKIVEIVCCRMSDLQVQLYKHFIHSKNVKKLMEDDTKKLQVLSSITAMKKLCNHPKLIYDTVKAGGSEAAGFEDCVKFFPPAMFSGRSGQWTGGDGSWVELSGKMCVLARLLSHLRRNTDDRIVLVSNYTQTLDLFAQICRERNYPFVRLDGTTSVGKRQKLVQKFNDPVPDEFAFLLSSKAGGCGLNLIGGNRLVLFDPDWNPANDKQAAARVWRDGQKKRVFIYRFLATGTIEEKVYQRQMSKEGLQQVVDTKKDDDRVQMNAISSEELRDLFKFQEQSSSDTHDSLNCGRCQAGEACTEQEPPAAAEGAPSTAEDIGGFAAAAGCRDILKPWERQVGTPAEEDLKSWAHHASPSTVPDRVMQSVAGDDVSFVFSCQIDGKLKPVESKAPGRPLAAGASGAAQRSEANKAGSTRLPTKPPGLAWRSPLPSKPGVKPTTPGLPRTVGAPTAGRGKVLSSLHPNIKKSSPSGPAGAATKIGAAQQGKAQLAAGLTGGLSGQPPKAGTTKKRSQARPKERAVSKKAKAVSDSSCSEESAFAEEEVESQEVVADSDDDF